MGIIIVMRSRSRRMYGRGSSRRRADWDGLKHLYRTGTYDVEREAWDSRRRATLTGIPPLKRASKQKRESRSGRRGEAGGARQGFAAQDSRPASRRAGGAGWRSGRAAGRAPGLAARDGVGAGSTRLGPGPDRHDPGAHRPPRRRGPGDSSPPSGTPRAATTRRGLNGPSRSGRRLRARELRRVDALFCRCGRCSWRRRAPRSRTLACGPSSMKDTCPLVSGAFPAGAPATGNAAPH